MHGRNDALPARDIPRRGRPPIVSRETLRGGRGRAAMVVLETR
jgi:hypothetical protein